MENSKQEQRGNISKTVASILSLHMLVIGLGWPLGRLSFKSSNYKHMDVKQDNCDKAWDRASSL